MLGVAGHHPGRPGPGEAVGLRLVLDARAVRREPDPALDGVTELVGQHDRRQRPAVVVRQLGEQRAVVRDRVAVGVVEGVVLGLLRLDGLPAAADPGGRIGAVVDVARVDGEVAALQRRELLAVGLGELVVPERVDVDQRVADRPIGGPVDGAGDGQLPGGDVDRLPGAGRGRADHRVGAAGEQHAGDRQCADGAQQGRAGADVPHRSGIPRSGAGPAGDGSAEAMMPARPPFRPPRRACEAWGNGGPPTRAGTTPSRAAAPRIVAE